MTQNGQPQTAKRRVTESEWKGLLIQAFPLSDGGTISIEAFRAGLRRIKDRLDNAPIEQADQLMLSIALGTYKRASPDARDSELSAIFEIFGERLKTAFMERRHEGT
jgi:hypothetical protein